LPEIRPGVRCPTGEARITPGFDLPARFVIHTVGPIWRGGTNGEPQALASCYANSLRLAEENGLASMAFPAVSCGVYGYPPNQAARIAVQEIAKALARESSLREILLTAFNPDIFQILGTALGEIQVPTVPSMAGLK
ncbi:MAG: O-acetyl-ADP-ribose deacetylase, partial [Deltaproteobacteria bacterium]|nr:O-acetyl-ADP-ribose deacetylase [Deltaproteobacteria bacterium]